MRHYHVTYVPPLPEKAVTPVAGYRPRFSNLFVICFCAAALILPHALRSQAVTIALDDLSAFQNPGKTWKIAGGVMANLNQENKLILQKGQGILVNQPTARQHGKDLYTKLEHGDVDVELDYLMAKGANAGIYLQGRYELQLLDSWGVVHPTSADNGGIYERWDESRPEGQKGYQGYAPRQNASRAPGLWQHLRISFQAPRFDDQGNKVEDAKFLLVELNGVPIHVDVALSGPTRGAMDGDTEAARGPLRIQGDHGAVALRNIIVTTYDKPRPELHNLRYSIYEGKFEEAPAFKELVPEAEGSSVILTSELKHRPQQFLMAYTGTLEIAEPGAYRFNLSVPGGGGLLRINEQEAIPISSQIGEGTIELPAGELPFELLYSKFVDWVNPALGLSVAGPGIREYVISDQSSVQGEVVDPIFIKAQEQPILRSFMDLPDGPRITHAVSVSSPANMHYTYDLDHGMIVQAWRGDFLDATPMWHSRGDGSSRPRGMVEYFGEPAYTLARLPSPQTPWPNDSLPGDYTPQGYRLSDDGEPVFRYKTYGTVVSDATTVLDNGRGLQRVISLEQPADNLYVRLVKGAHITPTEKENRYLVDGQTYYLELQDIGGAQPLIRGEGEQQELLVPIRSKIVYSLLF